MLYITGKHALNLPCELDTCGDWHMSALAWESLTIRDTKDSIFQDYGIEHNKKIPGRAELQSAANHIRALLDLLEMGRITEAQGMRRDFIGNEKYTPEVFEKASMLAHVDHWPRIDQLMGWEYGGTWLDYKKIVFLGDEQPRKTIHLIPEIEDINVFALKKAMTAQVDLQALIDLAFVVNRCGPQLRPDIWDIVKQAIEYVTLERMDYLIRTQSGGSLDDSKIFAECLSMYENLGLLLDSDDQEIIKKYGGL